jgi:large subunit ribosomal protein L23
MPILDRFRKKIPATKKPAAKKKAEASEEKINSASGSKGSALSSSLLRMPHVSEKAARLADVGTYVFRVPMSAEKISVRKAVESLYNVKVASVRMVSLPGKPMNRGKRTAYRSDLKKALVTLAKGQKLDLYEGV